jgi:hypothetical protein
LLSLFQVENEFGSYGDVQTNPLDMQYMLHLVALVRQYLGLAGLFFFLVLFLFLFSCSFSCSF